MDKLAADKKTYYERHREKILQGLRELRAYRKEHHLCVRCGKPVGELKTVTCTECLRADGADNRQYYKQHKKQCNEQARAYYYQNRERILQKQKERHLQRREQGLCIICGKPQTPHSISFCEDCLLKMKKRRCKKINN